MSNAAIQRAAEWQATRCKGDSRCIAEDRHKGAHRDIRGSRPSVRTLRLPKRFWEDHVDRGLWLDEPDREDYGKDVGRHYEVELTDRDVAELRSDADYYSDIVAMAEDNYYLGLQSSARATVKRLLDL